MTSTTETKAPERKAKWPYWIAAFGAVMLFCLLLMGSYNGLVGRDTAVQEASSNVKTLYTRRANLIPNLVKTVEAAGFQERDTLREVVEARANATRMTIDPSKATPEQLATMQKAQGELAQAFGKLLAVKEAYPDLKTNANFRDLAAQLEGSENRIQKAQQRYNGAVRDYKNGVLGFPSNIVNGWFGHYQADAYAMFESRAGDENAPAVTFQNPPGRGGRP